MSSLFWYICLAATGAGMTAFTVYRKKHMYKVSTLVVFYLFATGITWIGEFTALGIFNGYAYKPGIFADPWAENLAAHLILNSTLWPGAAMLVAVYPLSYRWTPLVVAYFILAEYLFAQLGIYEQHWWRYYMSAITVIIFLVITKRWFARMDRIRHGATRTTVLYFVSLVIIHLPIPFLLLCGKEHYLLDFIKNIVGDKYWASTIFIFSYNLLECFFLVYFVCVLKSWYWKLIPFAIAFAGQSLLVKMHILIFQNGWKLSYSLLIYAICLSVFVLIQKYALKPCQQRAIRR